MRFVLSCLATLLCLGTTTVFAAAPEPTTDEEKTLYALGLAVNQSLSNFSLSETEFEIVKSGITDGFLKRPPKVDLQAFGLKISELQQARALVIAEAEKKAGAAFLAKAAAESGTKKTESGAILKSLKEGNGAIPKVTDMVKVHYQGTLIDGTVFDNSTSRASQLVCPSSLAYRDKGLPPPDQARRNVSVRDRTP